MIGGTLVIGVPICVLADYPDCTGFASGGSACMGCSSSASGTAYGQLAAPVRFVGPCFVELVYTNLPRHRGPILFPSAVPRVPQASGGDRALWVLLRDPERRSWVLGRGPLLKRGIRIRRLCTVAEARSENSRLSAMSDGVRAVPLPGQAGLGLGHERSAGDAHGEGRLTRLVGGHCGLPIDLTWHTHVIARGW